MKLNSSIEAPFFPGGMGAGISDWFLAKTLATLCKVGVVSLTGIDIIAARRLQDGDLGGVYYQALKNFPIPQMGQRVWDKYFNRRGRGPNEPYTYTPMVTHRQRQDAVELLIVAAFVEVWLAKQGHEGIIGVNVLTKIETRQLPLLFGAMLANVDFVIAGAGYPTQFPTILEQFSELKEATYNLHVIGGDPFPMKLNPSAVIGKDDFNVPEMNVPLCLAVVSSPSSAKRILSIDDRIYGFSVEGWVAGGHGALPRGGLTEGKAIYGARDVPDLEDLLALNRPFWFAGGWGSHEDLLLAHELGAAGVVVGTPLAPCAESGMAPWIKKLVLNMARSGKLKIITDPNASPANMVFKVAQVPGTVAEVSVYEDRPRSCKLGCLRHPVLQENGQIGYRCPAGPEDEYVRMGGDLEDTKGKRCLCEGLMATAGYPQLLKDGSVEPAIVTLGDDLRILETAPPDYDAKYVVDRVLGRKT